MHRFRSLSVSLLSLGALVGAVIAARSPTRSSAMDSPPSFTVAPAPAATAAPAASLRTASETALAALANLVRPLSHPRALEDAFQAYYLFKAAHPEVVRKPLLYFVDYGLPSTERRGYVFDMKTLRIVEGPFTVAHGRGSRPDAAGVPTSFSNVLGSAATSLGLYVAKATYAFHGRAGGRPYSAVGLVLSGVSRGFNDNAERRRVVAHGAPYVTPTRAGQSEGCPAMEPARAARLLPQLADGGMVFLFAPSTRWMATDSWVAGLH